MADEKITIGDLGGYTNNSPNKEGIKKLIKALDDALSPDLSDYYTKEETDTVVESAISEIDLTDYYTKSETDTIVDAKQNILTAGSGISIENNVISATTPTGTFKVVNSTNIGRLFGDNSTLNYNIYFLVITGTGTILTENFFKKARFYNSLRIIYFNSNLNAFEYYNIWYGNNNFSGTKRIIYLDATTPIETINLTMDTSNTITSVNTNCFKVVFYDTD